MADQENGSDTSQHTHTPGSDAIDITPSKDGGVLKEIKKAGSDEAGSPLTGDKVFVHYVGTLTDGSKFDSSRDRGELFEFQLGKGQVIKAWDLGVATMKKGELAVLTCKSEYAYGKNGSPPKIPPDATLVFEVELFHWKGEDLTAEKDGGILRSTLDKGEGYTTPNDGATCDIQLVGRYQGRVFEDREVKFVLGEGPEEGLVEAIETAVQKSKKGERSKLIVKSEYAYGSKGKPEFDIPPGAELEYEVTLKTFEKAKEAWEMDMAEKIEQSELMKQKGTDFFKKGNYAVALRYYKKIVEFLENETPEADFQEKVRTLKLAAQLNIAMCQLKTGDNLDAKHTCEKVLELEPNSEKGFFRRGTASMNLHNYEEAVADFKKVLEIDPNNKAAKNQVTIANTKIQQQKQKEKRLYAGMFDKFAQIDKKRMEADHARYWNSDLQIDQWDNKMADGMLPIYQEVEAFGETMPEAKYDRCEDKENRDPEN